MARWNSANHSRWHHLFKKFAEKGHTVIVIQPPPRESEETNYIEIPAQVHKNIVLHTVPISPWFWNTKFPVDKIFKKAFYTIKTFFVLRYLIRVHQPDVLILNNFPLYLYTLGNSMPIVFDYADDYVSMLQHELQISPTNILSRLSVWMLRKMFEKSSLVVAVSKVLEEKIQNNSKIVISNGADVPAEFRETTELRVNKSKPVVGYVGAFEYSIDLDLMLTVAERMNDCAFLFVGAGRDFPRIKELVVKKQLNNVVLTGAVPHPQAMKYISEMQVCLNLRKKGEIAHAASPIKVFEYLINGKPIVSTRLFGLLRIDERGEIFYYADTLEEVMDQIRSILDDPTEKQKRIEHGRQLVLSTYTWDLLADRFLNAMQPLLNHKRS